METDHVDHVDHVVAQWRRERPDVDPSPIAVVARISRLSRAIDRALKPVFRAHALEAWEYDLLAALRREGPPSQLTAGQILDALMITSGAVTNRIDRLEQRGLVRRRPDPHDKRIVHVQLTAAGRKIIDRTLPAHLANEASLLSPLDPGERAELERLLRKLGAGPLAVA